ncbi:hypothetical protein KIW84_058254 [Lathyrus oleraceus]|uniref:Uncharacterized protein n=1 Tax=Pisum sativum TaxID=3888 RepID=A0A9D4X5I3_PEA|nr:hypothetical protein KIW84_058254 [Pisum sativum]
MITEESYGITDVPGSNYSSDSLRDSSCTVPENSEKMHSYRSALVTVRDGVQGGDECNRLLTEKQQQQFFEITDPEASDTAVPAPTVGQNDVVNNGRPVRQRALPHRLRDYERFQDNKVNNDGDFVHFALMAESELP